MAKTITSICCSSILRRSPCRSWSTASRACRAVCYANGGQKCGDDTRTVFCGRHPISSLHAAARHFRLSLTTSNPKEKRPPGALAYLPGLKAGVSREVLDELVSTIDTLSPGLDLGPFGRVIPAAEVRHADRGKDAAAYRLHHLVQQLV